MYLLRFHWVGWGRLVIWDGERGELSGSTFCWCPWINRILIIIFQEAPSSSSSSEGMRNKDGPLRFLFAIYKSLLCPRSRPTSTCESTYEPKRRTRRSCVLIILLLLLLLVHIIKGITIKVYNIKAPFFYYSNRRLLTSIYVFQNLVKDEGASSIELVPLAIQNQSIMIMLTYYDE